MWKTVQINRQNIKVDTTRAMLINCPHKSKFDGFSFWHPSKLIRMGKNLDAVSLSYTDDFTFTLKKYGKGRYNSNTVIEEKTITIAEFEEMFGVMNENITAPKKTNPFETHKPATVEPTETTALDELKDE